MKSKTAEPTLPPLDYQAWLARAWNFIGKCRSLPDEVYVAQIVKPPATKADFRRHLSDLPMPLPRSLAGWFGKGSAYCHLEYHWTPQSHRLSPLQRTTDYQFSVGGIIKFGPVAEIRIWFDFCENWSEPLIERSDDRAKHALALWRSSFPFCCFGNGDTLAVILSDSGPEPVVYLDHELPDRPFFLAPDFDEFLRRWEQLRYCDQPGLALHRDKSGLNPTSKIANQLREWLPAV